MTGVLALVIDADPRRPWLARRTLRSLSAAGIVGVVVDAARPVEAPCLLMRAGAVLRDPARFRPPPLVAGLVAVGLPPDGHGGPWDELQRRHGGDFTAAGLPPDPVCEWHTDADTVADRLARRHPATARRVVHWPPFDTAAPDERLRVWQVVTSPQHGGAERIAVDLATNLPAYGIASRLVVLGSPHRDPLPTPPQTLDLAPVPVPDRPATLAAAALAAGVDLLHLHLTDALFATALAATGIPLLATVHNARAAWPAGWSSLAPDTIALHIACARPVAADLAAVLPAAAVRTVWNGIDLDRFPERAPPPTDDGYTLVCIANPRPQKRLERLPAILAATAHELGRRLSGAPRVRLIVAGETAATLGDAVTSRAACDEAARRVGVGAGIEWTEGTRPVADVLATGHALVSCSAYEGLSLGHLEALASGLPIVATDTGGTADLAGGDPAVTLLAADTPPEAFAVALADHLLAPPPSARSRIARDFSVGSMAARVARLARGVACRPTAAKTIWFVSNNLSTGGAQSSLRRLARNLRAAGRRVRVALLQEYSDSPSPGRLDLMAGGIEVFVPPPAGLVAAEEAVDLILAEMAADGPAAVFFWNALAPHKLLLADALVASRVYDVSPGEMFFPPLERVLARPPAALPYRAKRDYGRLLAGLVVKYAAEAPRAAEFGAPVHVIPNGVPVPSTPGARTAPDGRPLVLATAARISPQKRLDDLLAAFRLALPRLPACRLVVAGGVETGAEACAAGLRRLATGLPVEWLGERHGLDSFHASSDLFVMVSDPAGCPNASLEALAAGLPVIATDVGGAAEQVVDGITGRLVPARDPAALAEAMIELAHDRAARERLGRAAVDHVRRMFSEERMLADYLRLVDGPT